MQDNISAFLRDNYGLHVQSIQRMSIGVGGDTFRVDAADGKYVFKIVKADVINRPELEPSLCSVLQEHGVPVSEFIRNLRGDKVSLWDFDRLCHLQRYVDGSNFAMNTAPDWFMAKSPLLLARIQSVLSSYPPLPEGIGAGFFAHMTPDRAIGSYQHSLAIARERGEEDVAASLLLRIRAAEKIARWSIDPARLTCCNTHGDYTVNQILCKDGQIKAVIDWTSACRHPVVWELTRSYFYAAPECADGGFHEQRLADYAKAYQSVMPMNEYDQEHLLDVYLYQLAVCNYYSQYLHAAEHERAEFRQQADFATKVLVHALL